MDPVLSINSLPKLKKGDTVRHSGMLCIVAGFTQKRLGVKLKLPDNKITLVTKAKLRTKEILRKAARIAFGDAQRAIKEYPDFMYVTAEGRARLASRGFGGR